MKEYSFPLILIILLALFVIGCGNNESDELKKQELELKEKELAIKEKEMMEKKEQELEKREKRLDGMEKEDNDIDRDNYVELSGRYEGSIKDGTRWEVFITSYDGQNLSGYNKVYWQKYPEGYKTSFSGRYNAINGQIIMYEDREAKGSGKFTGTVSDNGKIMSGDWRRYSDGGSFTWNLKKSN